jgi:hypothetical protein
VAATFELAVALARPFARAADTGALKVVLTRTA